MSQRSCAGCEDSYKSSVVRARVGVLFCSSIMLAGCGVARDAAVTSYHVAAAPVKLTRWMITDPPRPEKSRSSDVAVSGHPTAATSSRPTVTSKPKASPLPAKTSVQTEFPVAKVVPGKPGYVYSPYESGKYVDVSGYAPGSKVKDPYAQKDLHRAIVVFPLECSERSSTHFWLRARCPIPSGRSQAGRR